MANKLEKVFKAMEEQGWCIDNVKNLTPSKEWAIYLQYHLSVLEKNFIEYHFENKDKISETFIDSVGFITDFVNALKEVNYGE
jgi:hypothetical protein